MPQQAQNVIFEFQTPEGDILEWEGPENTPPEMVKRKFMQTILKNPQLSLTIAKTQGYNPGKAPDERTAGQVALDQTANVGKGAVDFVAGIPGLVMEAGGIAKDTLMGQHMKAGKRLANVGKGMAEGIAAPFTPVIQTATSELGLTPEATDEQWQEGAHAAGANLAGLVVPEAAAGARGGTGSFVARGVNRALPSAESLMSKAARARAAVDSLSVANVPTSRTGVAIAGVKTAARPAVNALASVAEKAAKIRAGRPIFEGAGYTSVDQPPAPEFAPDYTARTDMPVEPPMTAVGRDMSSDAVLGGGPRPAEPGGYSTRSTMQQAENRPPTYTEYAPDQNAPAQPPIGQEPLVSRDAMGQPTDPFVEQLRQIETPEQLYAREQARRNVEFQPEQTPEDLLGFEQQPAQPPISRDAMGQPVEDFLTQAEPAQQFDYPIQQLLPEEEGIIAGISRGGQSVSLNGPNGNLAIQNAPYLLEALPELKGTRPGQLFDDKLFNGFQRVGHELNAMEKSIPDTTPVPTADMTAALDQFAQEAMNTIQPSDLRVVQKVRDQLAKKSVMPWKDFIEAKRAFDKEIGVDPGVGSKIYQLFKDASNAVKPELGVLNQKYYTTKIAMDLAKMNPYKGLRLTEVANRAKGLRNK